VDEQRTQAQTADDEQRIYLRTKTESKTHDGAKQDRVGITH